MAVYELTYKQYLGKLTPEWSRFMVVPRHALRDAFKSKLFTAFYVFCFLPLLVEAILIYLHHNVSALAILQVNVRELLPIDNSFFHTFVNLQNGFAFFVALLLGPPLVARDLRNNALPLYLCRPFSRTEYVLGKMSVLIILLSLMTWVPQLLLFALQSYLQGASWFIDNLWIGGAIFMSSIVWILLLALLSQAISALVKWRVVASAALLGLFFIPSVFGEVVNQLFRTRYGSIVSIGANVNNVTAGLFGRFDRAYEYLIGFDGDVAQRATILEPPLVISWFVLFLICAVCLALLSWKVKAYEVVR
jgi:ABC-2 type transport system permease protein